LISGSWSSVSPKKKYGVIRSLSLNKAPVLQVAWSTIRPELMAALGAF
jgi:hypothetical protein